jgi:hypothetical protein
MGRNHPSRHLATCLGRAECSTNKCVIVVVVAIVDVVDVVVDDDCESINSPTSMSSQHDPKNHQPANQTKTRPRLWLSSNHDTMKCPAATAQPDQLSRPLCPTTLGTARFLRSATMGGDLMAAIMMGQMVGHGSSLAD